MNTEEFLRACAVQGQDPNAKAPTLKQTRRRVPERTARAPKGAHRRRPPVQKVTTLPVATLPCPRDILWVLQCALHFGSNARNPRKCRPCYVVKVYQGILYYVRPCTADRSGGCHVALLLADPGIRWHRRVRDNPDSKNGYGYHADIGMACGAASTTRAPTGASSGRRSIPS